MLYVAGVEQIELLKVIGGTILLAVLAGHEAATARSIDSTQNKRQ